MVKSDVIMSDNDTISLEFSLVNTESFLFGNEIKNTKIVAKNIFTEII